jgi:hypothetical protein
LSLEFDLPPLTSTTPSSTIKADLKKSNEGAKFRLTFINSHLPAFDEGYEKRNVDYSEIVRRMRFRPTPNGTGAIGSGEEYGLFESDTVIWMVRRMLLFG